MASDPAAHPPGAGGAETGGFTGALMATAEQIRLRADLPPQKDVLAAAALVLATATAAMQRIAATELVDPAAADGTTREVASDGAPPGEHEAVLAACVQELCARHLAAALTADGWPVALPALIGLAGEVVMAARTPQERARITAGGAATCQAMIASTHPRAREIKSQIETCFDVFARSGEAKPLTALALLYDALRRAGER
jgi:hypothetical protein